MAIAWLVLLLPGVNAQEAGLSVTPLDGVTVTAKTLVDELVGAGVETSDETYTTALQASGLFSGGTGIIGFESGVLLTSGDVGNVLGPNLSDSTGTDLEGVPGDGDLNAIAGEGAETEDAAVLEFTFVPAETTVTFRYAFGSDEYNEFVYQGFNDAFGFFVNGQNCATVPDPANPEATLPVSIDTVNGGNPDLPEQDASNPELYRNNDLDDGGGTINTELDGLTFVLTCTATVNPGAETQAKLAIADVGDGGWDSAVFLEGSSFSSGPTHTLNVTTSGDGDGSVSSSDEGISCDNTNPELNDCSEVYEEGTEVSLTASPNDGSVFGGWTGCESTEGSTCSVTMSAERTVDARFDPQSEEAEADLSVAKSDTASGFGPDRVSSGGVVAYQVSVGNGGPDDATGVTVTDTATNGTVQSASGTNWTCGDPVANAVTCTYDLTLDADTDAEDLTVLVKAGANPGTADITMSDTATVSGNEFDPNADNDSDTETTPITGSGSAFAKDHASTFFDGVTTTTLETTRDTAGGFYSRLVIPGNSGLLPGPVTIDEFNASLPAFDGFCGGKDCDAQVQITVLPFGRTPANNPIQVFWFYPKDTKQGSTAYVKGDNETLATVVRNCSVAGIANPPKCVSSKTVQSNGDRRFLLLWRDGGDPGGGKR
jgi:uncharacterized repeat protein (TIGR01451 family)